MLLALRLCLLDLLHDRNRSLLSLLGLAVVIFTFMVLSALSLAASIFLGDISSGTNLVVIRADLFDPAEDRLPPDVIEAALSLGETRVSRVAPIIFRHTRLNDRIVQLRSADFAAWETVFHLQLVRGQWPQPPNEVLLGEGLAQINRLDVGAKIQIFGQDFTVSGISRAPGSMFASIWMPLETAQSIFGPERGYQALFLQVAPGTDPFNLKTELQNDPRLADEYAVYLEDNYAHQNFDRMNGFNDLMKIASILAVFGIVFGVSNAVTLSLVERSRDLGILLGLGFSSHALVGLVWLRFLLLSLLAYILGAGLALAYTSWQGLFASFYVLEFPLRLEITPAILLEGLAWMLALSLLGTSLSTRSFARQRVVDLLRAV